MVGETVKKVFSAEKKAEEIIKTAKGKASEKIEKAKIVGDGIIKAKIKDARLKSEQRLNFAKQSQKKEADEIKKKAREEAEKIKNEVKIKSKAAIKLVLKVISE